MPLVASILTSRSCAEAQSLIADLLGKSGVEQPRAEARRLIAHALGLELASVLAWPDRPVGAGADRLVALTSRRLAGEPFDRLTGEREFHGHRFLLSRATLSPRPETETLVETAIRWTVARTGTGDLRILDLGTGSGCILIALLKALPLSEGVGVDLSAEAAVTARANAVRLGCAERARFAVMDEAAALAGGFDILVSNPPYIPTADIADLDRAVRDHDPFLALDGGSDGLDCYRRFIAAFSHLAAPGALVALEIGPNQRDPVVKLLVEAGFDDVASVADLAGRPRVIRAHQPVQIAARRLAALAF